ncbi:F-box/LRR-repeat protein At3g26922 [Sorghum bicolor]|uniref:F-box domain-containing protein n=1 Tax=Sorghum bicolor TaxID=4558 RepID=A0A1B6PQX0_SORBI|nr:F-box/LRR-repeat protein At3g26922 [Sorghum bicolor]KXG28050.1 hypothetical protein SORBI_3005G079500 [Sorghum bicolor]|eukprot:XP_021316661.1 F-box/LRR-repeat protein At3g26922 [Sorghum bicolor]
MPPGREDRRLHPNAAVNGGADLLSSLPEGILQHVLYFLPPHEAVRTSVLSRFWRDLWKSMTALRISDYGRWSSAADFNTFVNSLLLSRDRSPLREFEFCTYFHPQMQTDEYKDSDEVVRYVDMWIHHAFMCDVRVLKVIGMSLPRPMVLAHVPLIAKHLETLQLWSVLLDGCSMDFSRCERLEDLMMDDCRISAHRMVSKSLRRLRVCYCHFSHDTRTRISVPSLVSLRLDGNRGMTPFLETMPQLDRGLVRLGPTTALKDLDGSQTCVLLESLSNATDLELVTESRVTIFKQDLKWCPAFNKLKTLILSDWVLGRDIHALKVILQHAPILEKLILQLSDDHNYEIEMEESCSLVQKFLPSEHLKVFEVRCRKDDEMVGKLEKMLKACGITSITFSLQEP